MNATNAGANAVASSQKRLYYSYDISFYPILSLQYSPVKLVEQIQPSVAGPHSPWFPHVTPDISQSTLSRKWNHRK